MAFLFMASAASAQTFDFTGVITAATYDSPYNPVAVGSLVTGSFTFDFANAQTTSGTVGSSNWSYTEASVTVNPVMIPSSAPPTVFSLTLQAGSFLYSSIPADISAFNNSSIAGHHGILTASEFAEPASVAPYGFWESAITLNGYNGAGLPAAGAQGSGQLVSAEMGGFYNTEDFSIKSVTRAPEMDPADAAGGLILLFGALAVCRERRGSV
jgi:hypothetical protein